MKIAIIKYNAGNIQSVKNALNRLNVKAHITDNKDEIISSDKVIFPGVGEAKSAMGYLKNAKLDKLIPQLSQPFLGICLGLQLMCNYSEENNTKCLNIFNSNVKLFPPKLKVPHVGWNTITNLKGKLFDGIEENSFVYFVHSYYAELNEDTIAETDYILPFSASIQRNNFFATQFHPEKSGKVGEKILKNFLEI
ncbi:MAG: imidazole glycerol phosphate synthase subunit HisH [Candidatus Marinimicrobia bacterium]|nr:imidazole glycerol phosphate synthase subunit HisH [Candidatus Neomarinimicrobiota bacterium]